MHVQDFSVTDVIEDKTKHKNYSSNTETVVNTTALATIYIMDTEGNILSSSGTDVNCLNIKAKNLVGLVAFNVFGIDKNDFKIYNNFSNFKIFSTVNYKESTCYFEHFYFANYQGSKKQLCFTYDITQQKQAEVNTEKTIAQLQLQIATLKAESAFKDKIFSIISHDLRGPIGSLTALVELINEPDSNIDITDINSELHDKIVPLNGLLERLFRWATLSFNKGKTGVATNINLSTLVDTSIQLLKRDAGKKNILIKNIVQNPTMAFANADQIDIVIRNILANAVKFTPIGGTIVIACNILSNKVELSITDTGIGMDNLQLNNLFSVAQQTTYGTNNEKGTGLGLLICKEFIALNKGEIRVTSQKNMGSEFIIVLPKAG